MNPLLKIRFNNIAGSKIRTTKVYYNFTKEKVNEATGRSLMCRGVTILVSSVSHFNVLLHQPLYFLHL